MGKKEQKHKFLHRLPVAVILALLMTVTALAGADNGICDKCGKALNISGPVKKDGSNHTYTLKCPDYKAVVATGHTNVTLTYPHRYDVTYSDITGTKHTVTRICNHNYTNTELLGTGGCGYTDVSTVNHTYGQTYVLGETSLSTEQVHEIRQSCACGYVKSRTTEQHDFEYKGVEPVTDCIGNYREVMGITDSIYVVPHHHGEKYVCRDCGYVKWVNVTECDPYIAYRSFTSISGNNLYHNCNSYCSICGKSYSTGLTLEKEHNYGEWQYGTPLKTGQTMVLTMTHTCRDCGYTDSWTFTHSHSQSELRLYTDENTHTYCYDCTGKSQDGTLSVSGDRTYEGTSPQDIYPRLGYSAEAAQKAEELIAEACENDLPAPETGDHYFHLVSYTRNGNNVHTENYDCSVCGYRKNVTENCTMEYVLYSQRDSGSHLLKAQCECGNTDWKYEEHRDENEDGECDVCGYVLSRISVTVPACINLTLYPDGRVTFPGNPEITNHSSGRVKISDIRITENDGWQLVPYSTSMADVKVDSKKMGIRLLGYESGRDTVNMGSYYSVNLDDTDLIDRDSSLPLNFGAKVSATQYAVSGSTPVIICYTLMLI